MDKQPNRDYYDFDDDNGYFVWSLPLRQWCRGFTLLSARANREKGERVQREHMRKGGEA